MSAPIAAKLVGGAAAQVEGAVSLMKNNGGWSVIGTRSVRPSTSFQAGFNSQTTRYEFVATDDIVAIRATFLNTFTNGIGENPFPGRILLKCAIQPQGASINASVIDELIPMKTGGKEDVWVKSGGDASFELYPFYMKKGERAFFVCYISNCQDAPPAAPTLSGSGTGGGLQANTHTVSLTHVYPDGRETQGSATSAVTTTGSGSSITVTSPAAASGAIGYKVYMSAPGIASPQYYNGSGVVPYGTNYVITSSLSTGSNPSFMAERVTGGVPVTFPVGPGVSGGTATNFVSNNGEGHVESVDYCIPGRSVPANSATSAWGPIAIEGIAASGGITKGVAIVGDSILEAIADYGFMPTSSAGGAIAGGGVTRALLNQTGNRAYNPAIAPLYGFTRVATGGERGDQFAAIGGGTKRKKIAAKASTIIMNYLTNDLSNNSTVAQIIANAILPNTFYFTKLGKKVIYLTCLPRASSTGGWRDVASQSLRNNYFSNTIGLEGHRRAANNFLLSSSGPTAVVDQPMFACLASATAATNVYLADGTARIFIAGLPFVQGSEVIKFGGATKAVGSDYSYTDSVVINGITYASAVLFTVAPGAGLSVTASYTSISGYKTLAPNTDVIDWAKRVEVDSNGVEGTNGGFWKPDASTLDNGTSSGGNSSTTLNDTAKAWTANQWRGYSMYIASDPGNPSAAGQVRTIGYNSATQLSTCVNWDSTPSSQAQYIIGDARVQDATHPTTKGAMDSGAEILLNQAMIA